MKICKCLFTKKIIKSYDDKLSHKKVMHIGYIYNFVTFQKKDAGINFQETVLISPGLQNIVHKVMCITLQLSKKIW